MIYNKKIISILYKGYLLYYSMSDSSNEIEVSQKEKIDECKKYNIEVWNCIEKHNNTVKYCGKPFYYLYRCFNSIKT